MSSLIPVRQSQIKNCRTCGAQITFAENRSGKWFAVDVFPLRATGEMVYRVGVGMHNNLTPWHKCAPPQAIAPTESPAPVDPQATRKRELALRLVELSQSGVTGDALVQSLRAEFADLECESAT